MQNEESKNIVNNPSGNSDKNDSKKFKSDRRNVFKALVSLPVFTAFGYQWGKKQSYDSIRLNKNKEVLQELGLSDQEPMAYTTNSRVHKNNIRIGLVGCGSRSVQLLRAAGFISSSQLKEWTENEKFNINTDLSDWLSQEDLNISIVGVCDAFYMRAENAIEISKNSLKSVKESNPTSGAKRFKNFDEMLSSKDIDAVIIATPDHHHASMTIAAVQAGKHVYCEKNLTRTEEEIYQVYDAVKNGGVVFQLGHQIRHNPIYARARDLVRKGALGHVNLVECTTNRNGDSGAWIRHMVDGKPKPGDTKSIDWDLWLGNRPKVPFSIDRYYNWTKWFDYATGLGGQLFSHEFDAINGILECGIPKTCIASGGIYHYKDNREIPDVFQAVYEYPDRDMTLMYSATLANSRSRGRVIMGSDASMEIGNDLNITVDSQSKKYQKQLKSGAISTDQPLLAISPNSSVDGISSATAKYYASRGLTNTVINGKNTDITHLHIKEWLDAIRYDTPVSCGIDISFQEAVAVIMGMKSYREKRMVEWDSVNRKIV